MMSVDIGVCLYAPEGLAPTASSTRLRRLDMFSVVCANP
jgi:hypothetical protein